MLNVCPNLRQWHHGMGPARLPVCRLHPRLLPPCRLHTGRHVQTLVPVRQGETEQGAPGDLCKSYTYSTHNA